MSNLEKSSRLLQDWADMHSVDMDMYHVARKLLEADLLAPDVQVIRTAEELEALDPDAVTINNAGAIERVDNWLGESGKSYPLSKWHLPAVVIATGEQVRAAREAMGTRA